MPYKHQEATLTDFQKQVCLGTLLGDSSLSMPKKNGRNYHLSCYHSEKQIEWLRLKWQWLKPLVRPIQLCQYLDKRDGKTRAGGRFHTISAPCFTDLANLFYQDGRKTITQEMVSKLSDPIALACLICDDGSWDKAGIQIASKQFNEAENFILAAGLSAAFGFIAEPHQTGKFWYVRIPATSIERVRSLCLPLIPDSMKYKFGGEYYATRLIGKVDKVCPVCNQTFSSYLSANQEFCNHQCAAIGRPSGYQRSVKLATCKRCGTQFHKYNTDFCPDCRGKRIEPIPCKICGKPVEENDRVTCSKPCSVALGHRNR